MVSPLKSFGCGNLFRLFTNRGYYSIHVRRSISPQILPICAFHSSTQYRTTTPDNRKDSKLENEANKQIVPEIKPNEVADPKPVKPSLMKRIKDEMLHYYHGFRLLLIDIKISSGLAFRLLTGRKLTRREYKLLIRTTSDVFRLLPFSVFIIVPFMELLLPIFLKLFPGMLPSTFQSSSDRVKPFYFVI